MKILYHHDADGYCAGYWAYKKFADQKPEMIMADYGMSMSWMNRVEPDEKIIIVDYSLDVIDMEKLLRITKDVIWIDKKAFGYDTKRILDFMSEQVLKGTAYVKEHV